MFIISAIKISRWQRWQQNNTFFLSGKLILRIPHFAEFSKKDFWNRNILFFAATSATYKNAHCYKPVYYKIEINSDDYRED